jgi:isoamylase
MTDEAREGSCLVKCLGVRLAGDLINDVDERGEPIQDETALILLNAHHEAIEFVMPETREGQIRRCVRDTSHETDVNFQLRPGESHELHDRTLALVFTRVESQETSRATSRSEVEALWREARKPGRPILSVKHSLNQK